MRSLLLFAVAAAPLFAQEAAPPPVQLPQPQLNFRDFKLPGRPNPFHLVNPVTVNPAAPPPKLNFVAAAPKNCSIPLIEAKPKGNFPMTVVKPGDPDPKMSIRNVPAPACVTPGQP